MHTSGRVENEYDRVLSRITVPLLGRLRHDVQIGAYIHDPVSPPPGRDQLMRLPHTLPIRPLEKTKAETKTKTKTIGPNPGLDSAPSSWDHPHSTPVPALPTPRSPTSTSSSYILALRPRSQCPFYVGCGFGCASDRPCTC
jgi:hypothetical protein